MLSGNHRPTTGLLSSFQAVLVHAHIKLEKARRQRRPKRTSSHSALRLQGKCWSPILHVIQELPRLPGFQIYVYTAVTCENHDASVALQVKYRYLSGYEDSAARVALRLSAGQT
ncbi:hypothetical protein VTO42DRAFT_169 [Malbranchea cinnamomea]